MTIFNFLLAVNILFVLLIGLSWAVSRIAHKFDYWEGELWNGITSLLITAFIAVFLISVSFVFVIFFFNLFCNWDAPLF